MNEKRILKQKLIAKLVLNKTKKYFPSAVVAGGAPRNWYGNMVAKDIDIFLFPEEKASLDQVIFDLHLNPDNLEMVKGTQEDSPEEDNDISNFLKDFSFSSRLKPKKEYSPFDLIEVWEIEIRGERVQWIFVNKDRFDKIEKFIEGTFDFEICKVYFDGNDIITTDGFKEDYKNKTFTTSINSLLTTGRINTLPKRTRKLQNLFPDFRINIIE